MFPKMRRIKQQLSHQAAEAVLLRGTSGVLSLLGEDGYPYGVPLSYVYRNGKLLFHCATKAIKGYGSIICSLWHSQDLRSPHPKTGRH